MNPVNDKIPDGVADSALQALKTTFYTPKGAASLRAGRLLTEWLLTRERFEVEISYPGGSAFFHVNPTGERLKSGDYATVNDLLQEPNGQKTFGEKGNGMRGLVPAHLEQNFDEALWEAEKDFLISRCGVPADEADEFAENNDDVLDWRAHWLADFVERPLTEVLDEAYSL